MVGKLLKIILPDKTENRKVEMHKQALDLCPGYSDFKTHTNIILVTIYSKLDQADISTEQIRRVLINFKHNE